MSESLFSPYWYRVAHLHPRLQPHVRIKREHWRGQRWYVLSNDATGRQHMINEPAYQFIGRCDGRHDVQRVWDCVLDQLGDDAPTQDEIIQLLIQLNEQDLIQSEHTPDTDKLVLQRKDQARRKRGRMLNPFAFQLPLGDPSGWLHGLDSFASRLFRPAVFWAWLALISLSALTAAINWSELQAHARTNLLTPRYLTLCWLLFPLIKALHELGHALAVRRWGGEVHQFGIALLALVPAPYVDASASAGFERRSQRAAVAAAGIMVETTIAALALFTWLNVQPGLVRDIAFAVLVIGGISTLLVNGNPLLRFDGYYVLCDLLDLPNLGARSHAYWSYLVRRYLLGTPAEPPQSGQGERFWLLLYAPLSLVYRLGISLLLVLWLGAKWFLLGALGAIYLVSWMAVRPLLGWMKQGLAAAPPGAPRRRAQLGLALGAALPGLVLFVMPAPLSTIVPAVVWVPEQAHLRAEVEGFIVKLPVHDGMPVQRGDLLVVLDNPDLIATRDQLTSRLDGLRADQYQLLLRDPAAAQNLAEQIGRTEAELERIKKQIDQLEVRAQVAGKLAMPHQADAMGRFAHRGENLGLVLDSSAVRVRAAVSEDDAYLVRNRARLVEVRLAERPGDVLRATMTQEEPAASHLLPSPALGDRGGGPYATDPSDGDGRKTLEPVFIFDLTLAGASLDRVGGRAWVRFDHGFEPLAMQGFRHLTQLFLKHFDARD
ncbi:MAG TPA: efflux RND transporter periplasmic adaptor subunit [Burkholderiales bacterium]|nr:efflux RND transporter periplasmic adaptor subunit [Burkholderiales bacterium]